MRNYKTLARTEHVRPQDINTGALVTGRVYAEATMQSTIEKLEDGNAAKTAYQRGESMLSSLNSQPEGILMLDIFAQVLDVAAYKALPGLYEFIMNQKNIYKFDGWLPAFNFRFYFNSTTVLR